MIKKLNIVFFITLLLSTCENSFSILAQDSKDGYTLFDLFGCVSYSSGVRLGGRMQISEHFSFETGFGRDLANYLGPSDKNYRYSIGINWHKNFESNLVVNATYIQPFYPPNLTAYGYAISINIGSLSLVNNGFHFFYSGGIWLKRSKNIDFIYVLPNFEFGVGWRIN